MKRLILYIVLFIATLETRGQELQFSQPIKLGPEVNSDDEELAPMLSPDGNTLYFSRAFHSKNTGGKYAGTDIWITRKDANGNWTPAVNAGKAWNNKRSNAVIGISADGTTVYLLNAYNNKSGISFSKLVNGKWMKPEFISVPGINRDDFVGIYVHPSFDVMLISMKGKDSYGEEDLYVSLKDSLGNWNQPQNLGPTINTKGYEISPFLSADKKRVFFSSNGHPGYGDADVFYCERLYESWQVWLKINSMGELINSDQFESSIIMPNDSILYFTCVTSALIASDLHSVGLIKNRKINYLEEVSRLLTESKNLLSEIQQTKIDTILPTPEIVYYENDEATEFDQVYVLIFNRFISYLKSNPNASILLRMSSLSLPIDKQRINSLSNKLKAAGINQTRVAYSDSIEPFELKKSSVELSIQLKK